MGSEDPRRWWIALAVFTCTLIVFAPALDCDFIKYDDEAYVVQNERVSAGLTAQGIIWAFTTSHASNWHPLTWLSHMLDAALYGSRAWGHHLSSLLLHAANAALLFLLLVKMTGARWRSLFVAAVFALHPLRVESVVWVAERKDVLSGFFALLCTCGYVRYAEREAMSRYLPVLFLFALGLMAKPMLVTLPLVFLLLDCWPLGRFRLEKRIGLADALPLIREKLPLLLLAAAASVVTLVAQGRGEAIDQQLALDTRLANAFGAYLLYIKSFFWPSRLAVFYPHLGGTLEGWQVLASVIVLLGITSGAILMLRSKPFLAVGWLWFAGMMVPVSGVIQVGSQAMADRYTYLPMIGLAIAIVWGVDSVLGRRRRPQQLACALAFGIVFALVPVTRAQIRHWSSNQTLFEHALRVTRDNFLAHRMVALELADQGRVHEAIDHLSRSLELSPDDGKSHNNLGNALLRVGRTDEAIRHLQKAIRLQPDEADAHYNLGKAFFEKPRISQAIAQFRECVRLDPKHTAGHYALGVALTLNGSLESAVAHYTEAIRIDPDYADAHYNVAVILAKLGTEERAIHHYREVVRLEPENGKARESLAVLTGGVPAN